MIDSDGKNDEIVRAIVTLTRNLGLKVIAEGVETAAQLGVLIDIECEGAQGFFVTEPMHFESCVNLSPTVISTALRNIDSTTSRM